VQRTDRLRIVFVLLFSLVGTAALFLPFSSGVSPFDVVAGQLLKGDFFGKWFLLHLAIPFFLSIPILIWQARRLFVDHVTKGEIATAYALSTAPMLSTAVSLGIQTFYLVWEPSKSGNGYMITALVVSWLLLIANVLLLMRNRRARLSREATAEVFLLGGYLPNAIFCLVAFYPEGWFSGWGIGAYLIAVVSIGYLAAIVLLSRHKPAGTPGAVEVPA
jgi:cation transport ATPase